jgi:hypothetical protein
MKRLLVMSGVTLAFAASSMFGATIGYTSTLVGPTSTETTYSLSLPDFNSALGTLTGVTLYFFSNETASTFSVKNISGNSVTADISAAVNLALGFANSANSADKFLNQNLTIFDTGIAGGPGSCAAGSTPAPGTCSQITVAGGGTNTYGPISVSNTNPTFGFTTGTGVAGLTGVVKAGTVITDYIGGGNFTLSGGTKNTSTFSGDGGNFQVTQVTTAKFQAEVDYTYTPASPSTPEPATMTLFGSALLGIGFMARKRVKKS